MFSKLCFFLCFCKFVLTQRLNPSSMPQSNGTKFFPKTPDFPFFPLCIQTRIGSSFLQAGVVPKDTFMLYFFTIIVVSGMSPCFCGMSKGGNVELKAVKWSFKYEPATRKDTPDTTDYKINLRQNVKKKNLCPWMY